MCSRITRLAAAIACCAIAAISDAAAQGAPPERPVARTSAAPPAPEPDLLQPLTPLSQFKLQAQQPLGPAPKPPEKIAYDVKISGLATIGLEDRFRALSSLVQDRGKTTSIAEIQARADEDRGLAERLMRSLGYYDGAADITVSQGDGETGAIVATVDATPGKQYDFGQIVTTGPATVPPDLARKALTINTGDPIVAANVMAAEANVTLHLPEQGYPFVQVGARDITLDSATHVGDYTLPVDPGLRSSFGGFRAGGQNVFTARHIAVLARFKRGQLYDSRKVDDLRRALVATGLYGAVGVKPVDTGAQAGDGAEIVDLAVDGRGAPPRTLSASLGYSTGEGVKLEGAWTHRNLFPPEGALAVRAAIGTQTQLASVAYIRSNAGRRDRSVQIAAQTSHEVFAAYEANTASLAARVSRDSTPIWQKHWTYSAGVEALVSDELGYDFGAGARVRRQYEIAALPLQLGYDRSDSLLDPTKGFRVALLPSPEYSVGAQSAAYLKTIVQASAYHPFGKRFVLAARLRLGSVLGASAGALAPSRRFYAGGGGSVRGFGYQELGPKDSQEKPIGGASLIETSIEGRVRFGNWGVATFVDGGQVYQHAAPSFSNMRFGAGVGARYYTAFGPIRLDIATPIDRGPGESLVAVYISIGQAF